MPSSPAQLPLDATDQRIITTVQRDGRISLTDLAREVHLGLSATRVRLGRLHDHSVITGYTARVDAAALGYKLRAIVRLRIIGNQDQRVLNIIESCPQIVRCLRVTGDICYILEIVAIDITDLERTTTQLAPLGEMTTDLIYEITTDRPLP